MEEKMKVLIVGSGGREHAIATAVAKSPKVDKIYCAPGNAGTASFAENIAIEYEIICEKEVKVDVIEELLKEDDENEKDLKARPPVVCVMGHVDHG